MRRLLLAFTASSLTLTAAACGDDATQPADTTSSDTTAPDTTAEDTATPDGDNPDTVSDDTASPDTMSEDTTIPDTMSDDTTATDTVSEDTTTPDTTSEDTGTTDTAADDTAAPSRCACEGGASCIEANTPDGCPLVTSTCTGGGMSIADSCDESDAMAVCVRSATTRVWDYAQTSGWLASAASACDDGTFTVTAIPEGVGDVCSCQRSAGACVQTYGDACDSLSCDAGVQAAACSDTGRRPERCVTRDGQREIVFYASAGISATQAETTCLGASANVLYWYPAFD